MLRISFDNAAESVTVKLEGKVAGPWVDELEQTWYEFTRNKPAQSVVVDLSGVDFIDREGRKLVGWMFRQGAELQNGRLITQYIVDQIKHEGNGSENNGG